MLFAFRVRIPRGEEDAVRFEVSAVLDSIEQRLTTDVTVAQAVLDFESVTRYADLDGGRGANLLRIGIVVDALARYLRDGGATVYAVVPRALLSDADLPSNERMVLSRWAEEGRVELVPRVGDRVYEVAELAGLAVIRVGDDRTMAGRYPWLVNEPGRVLRVQPRSGVARLIDGAGGTGAAVRHGAADPTELEPAPAAKIADAETIIAPGAAVSDSGLPGAGVTAPSVDGPGSAPVDGAGSGQDNRDIKGRRGDIWPMAVAPGPRAPLPLLLQIARTALGASLLARLWRCDVFECALFGEHRRNDQPVPHVRDGVPVCPRHGAALRDIGARPLRLAVNLVVDGVRRLRFGVGEGQPVVVGRAPRDPADIAVARYLHPAAAGWISRSHLVLEVCDGHLTVTDTSSNGTVVWHRAGARAQPETVRLGKGQNRQLTEFDSVELYTGIEVCRADRAPLEFSPDEPASVMADAPTFVTWLVKGRSQISRPH
jgi:hypothetical protein